MKPSDLNNMKFSSLYAIVYVNFIIWFKKLFKLKVPLFISEIMIFEIKYPDMTKNKSTPSQPPLNTSKSAW